MSNLNIVGQQAVESTKKQLARSGYPDKAIAYYIDQPNMGCIDDADHVTEVTGVCGDTMTVYLKLDGDRIEDAKFEVLGCPGAVASAMAAGNLIKGKTLEESRLLNDRDILRDLTGIPDQKTDCVHLAMKTVHKAVHECLHGETTCRAVKRGY